MQGGAREVKVRDETVLPSPLLLLWASHRGRLPSEIRVEHWLAIAQLLINRRLLLYRMTKYYMGLVPTVAFRPLAVMLTFEDKRPPVYHIKKADELE